EFEIICTLACNLLTQVELQVVHIVDLSCSAAHPWQWLKLLDDFHGRPGGAPELYLTVLHDDNDFLAEMQSLLSKKAESLEVSFRFISVIGRLETLDFSNLRSTFQIKFGVAVAISCALQMHRLLLVDDNLSSTSIAQLQKMANFTQPKQMASSVCSPASTLNYLQTPSPRTPKLLARLLSAIRALKPNIMVIMEQDADHNALLFRDRFNEVLNYYAALFDCFHAVAAANPGRTDERLRVERMILREEIKNILVCEGVHRHERHERLDQWAMHMEESGFHNVQLSFSAIREGKENLLSFGLKNCQNKEDRGCLLLSWGSTNLYSISVWRQNRGSSSGSREHMLLVQRQIIWPFQ
ncbi:Os12g0138166, partial [Oryza sativa Japonica Group]